MFNQSLWTEASSLLIGWLIDLLNLLSLDPDTARPHPGPSGGSRWISRSLIFNPLLSLSPGSCRLSLDPDTAHPTLFLLEGPQGAHCGEEPQSYPLHPLRFDSVAQVLCREGQFGGASYWEVEWRGGEEGGWTLG